MMRFALAVVLLLPTWSFAGQGFDCAKAQTRVERLVCADAGLRDLDEYLGRYYAAARAELDQAASCLRGDQAQWLKTVRDACTDTACLRTAYLNRLAELDPLQPGVTAIKNLSLPAVPALVWVIGPAADRAAAPPRPNARPLEASGAIVDDLADGDGFMLRTSDGTTMPIALLMFLEGKSAAQLHALARAKDAAYRVRGYAASDGRRTYFEPSRCTFIHRLPGR